MKAGSHLASRWTDMHSRKTQIVFKVIASWSSILRLVRGLPSDMGASMSKTATIPVDRKSSVLGSLIHCKVYMRVHRKKCFQFLDLHLVTGSVACDSSSCVKRASSAPRFSHRII